MSQDALTMAEEEAGIPVFFRPDERLWLRLIHTPDGISSLGNSLYSLMSWAAVWWPPEAVPEHWGPGGAASRGLSPWTGLPVAPDLGKKRA